MGEVMKGITLWLMYFNFSKKKSKGISFAHSTIKWLYSLKCLILLFLTFLAAKVSQNITQEKNLHLTKASLVDNYFSFKEVSIIHFILQKGSFIKGNQTIVSVSIAVEHAIA